MPHVILTLWPGKTEQPKRQLADTITEAVTPILHWGDESVSVAMEGVAASDRAKPVHSADIEVKADQLYKQPGCKM